MMNEKVSYESVQSDLGIDCTKICGDGNLPQNDLPDGQLKTLFIGDCSNPCNRKSLDRK